MNQNAPLWNNGQTPSSASSGPNTGENNAEEQARSQNRKSKSNKHSR